MLSQWFQERKPRGGGGNTIVEAIEHVKEHRSNISMSCPIILHVSVQARLRPRVPLLPRITAPPNHHRKHKQHSPSKLRSHRASQAPKIKHIPKDICANNLTSPIKHIVERSGPDVELGAVKAVKLVRVKPVAGDEHGEEEDDPDVRLENFPEAEQFAAPGWVFHEDYMRAVRANNVVGVYKGPGKAGAEEGEDHEANVGAVGDVACGRVDVFAQRNP